MLGFLPFKKRIKQNDVKHGIAPSTIERLAHLHKF